MHQIGLHTLAASAIFAIAIPLPAQNAPCQQTAPCPVNPPKQPKPLSFTAEIKIHSVQTLADGTTITRDGKELHARDSQNRSFNSRTNPFGPKDPAVDAYSWSNANDPVEGTQTNWDSRNRKARVLKMPPRDQQHGCWVSASGGQLNFNWRPTTHPPPTSGPSMGTGAGGGNVTAFTTSSTAPPSRLLPLVSEDLGTAVIMGIEAHGTRTTISTPAGVIGNDKPIFRTNEVWVAPGLGIPLRQIITDPRTGSETREVLSLDLSEPPLSTFQPPEGYEITVDEFHEVPCGP